MKLNPRTTKIIKVTIGNIMLNVSFLAHLKFIETGKISDVGIC